MKTFTVQVTQYVKVTVDETKFDDKFMEEFRAGFYPIYTLAEHSEHLAQMYAHGIDLERFIEGYGPPNEMGISLEEDGLDTEVIG